MHMDVHEPEVLGGTHVKANADSQHEPENRCLEIQGSHGDKDEVEEIKGRGASEGRSMRRLGKVVNVGLRVHICSSASLLTKPRCCA